MWSQPGRGSLTGSRTRCTVHLGSFASRRITHISTDSCTSLTARTSSGNGMGCSNAPRPGRQSVYSDLQCYSPSEFRTEHFGDSLCASAIPTRCSRQTGNTAAAATTAVCPRSTTRDSTPRTCEIGINVVESLVANPIPL